MTYFNENIKCSIVQDALVTVVEAYEDLGWTLSACLKLAKSNNSVWLETLAAA